MKYADRIESEFPVKRAGSWVRHGVPRDDPVNVLASQRIKKSAIKGAPSPLVDRVRRAVDRGFNGRVIGRLGTKSRRACIPQYSRFALGDEQAIPPAGTELLEPCGSAFDCVRFKVKCDWSVDDVVIVNFGQARQISFGGLSNLKRAHPWFAFAARVLATSSQEGCFSARETVVARLR